MHVIRSLIHNKKLAYITIHPFLTIVDSWERIKKLSRLRLEPMNYSLQFYITGLSGKIFEIIL